jgi:hypothetical protein
MVQVFRRLLTAHARRKQAEREEQGRQAVARLDEVLGSLNFPPETDAATGTTGNADIPRGTGGATCTAPGGAPGHTSPERKKSNQCASELLAEMTQY